MKWLFLAVGAVSAFSIVTIANPNTKNGLFITGDMVVLALAMYYLGREDH